MNNIISFNYYTIIDNYIFGSYIWQKFYDLIFLEKQNYIVIDISRVRMVKPEVLPKLCCLGQIARRNGVRVELNLNPASNVKDYLFSIGFLDIVRKQGIFILDDDQIGGECKKGNATKTFICIDKNLKSKYEQKYTFHPSLPEEKILKYCVGAEIFGEEYLTRLGEFTTSMINRSPVLSVLNNVCDGISERNKRLIELGDIFVELVHNTIWHGKTECFISLQAATYKSKNGSNKFGRVDICISDYGSCLYDTLANKDWKKEGKEPSTMPLDKFLSLSSEKDQNFYSVLEMIYFRKNDLLRGVYDIMKYLVTKKKLNIMFINKNLQISLNRNYAHNNEALMGLLQGRYDSNLTITKHRPIDYGFSMDISFET